MLDHESARGKDLLDSWPCAEVWGIAGRLAARLEILDIRTAGELARAERRVVRPGTRRGERAHGGSNYAFWQHILASLAPESGRCAILFPHGVLFRQEEAEMRRRLVEADVVECVLGLGPNLFYNSPMEACVVVCRAAKPAARRGRVLFINAVNEVTRERAQSFLTADHLARIVQTYERFADVPGLARVACLEEIRSRQGNLSIPLYVAPAPAAATMQETDSDYHPGATNGHSLSDALGAWMNSAAAVRQSLRNLLEPTQ